MIDEVVIKAVEQIRQQLPPHVRLLAVSKKVSVASIRAAYGAGIRDFAESRIQEALPKQEELQDLADICWHFIGHIQTNKARKVIENFDWIHSCDNLKLTQRLNRIAGELSKSPHICLQVKILSDPHKSGWSREELLTDLPQLDQCHNLQIQGLMTILPLGLSETQALSTFGEISALATEIQQQNWSNLSIKELSMGMSGDYQLAVTAGATMVRLGRILFGVRAT